MAVHRRTTTMLQARDLGLLQIVAIGECRVSGDAMYISGNHFGLRLENSLSIQPLVLRFVPSRVEIVKLSQVKRAEVNEPS